MELKVNHNEVNTFCDMSEAQSEILSEQIEIWNIKLDELKEVWQGDDADKFFENAGDYVRRLNVIPECYNTLHEFVGKANNEYHNQDMENKREFEKDPVMELEVRNG